MPSALLAPIASETTAGLARQLYVNARDFAVQLDGVMLLDVSMTAGSHTAHSLSQTFTAFDVGKIVTVMGAGTPGTGGNAGISAPLCSIITGVSNGDAILNDAAQTTVSGAMMIYGTDNGTRLQNAINQTAAIKGTLFIPHGLACSSLTLDVVGTLKIMGAGRYATGIELVGNATAAATLASTGALINFELADLSIGGGYLGMAAALTSGSHNGVLIRNVLVTRGVYSAAGGIGWPMAIGNAPATYGTQISYGVQVVDSVFQGNEPFNESLILINCQDFAVRGCLFKDNLPNTHSITSPGGGAVGLALWAYDRNGVVSGCQFDNNYALDCYIQESDGITYTGNVHWRGSQSGGSSLSILNCRGITVADCELHDPYGTSVAVSCHDMGATVFNYLSPASPGHAHLYASSYDIKFHRCSFDGYNIGFNFAQPTTISGQRVAPTNLTTMHDVTVEDCTFDNMAGDAPFHVGNGLVMNLLRFAIRRCKINGGDYGTHGAIILTATPAVSGSATAPQPTAVYPNLATINFSTNTLVNVGTAMYVHVSDGTNSEDAQVQSYSATGGTGSGFMTAYLVQSYSGPITISAASIAAPGGVTDLTIDDNIITAGTQPNCNGIYVNGISSVRITRNDLHAAASGTGVPIKLLSGAVPLLVRHNIGHNPYGGAVTQVAFPSASGSWVNTTGYDVYVQITTGGATGINGQLSDASGGNFISMTQTAFTIPAGATFKVGAYTGGTPSWTLYAN